MKKILRIKKRLQVLECSLPLPPAIPASLASLVGTSCSYSGILDDVLVIMSKVIDKHALIPRPRGSQRLAESLAKSG